MPAENNGARYVAMNEDGDTMVVSAFKLPYIFIYVKDSNNKFQLKQTINYGYDS